MIRDLSLTLQAILDDTALATSFPQLNDADIVFDSPTETFSPQQTTVSLFLYDIRENVEMRNNERDIERQNSRAVIHRPPLRVMCSYLVTAWPGNVTGDELFLQEQRLLSQVLQVLSRHPTIPVGFLKGSLIGQEPPLPILTAQENGLANPAEFWTAIGNQLRPSLTVTATFSMTVFPEVTAPIVTTKFTGIDVGRGAVEETMMQIGGRVVGPGGEEIAGALVDILEIKQQTKTDREGGYTFLRVPVGAHTIRVVAAGFEPQTQPLVVPGGAEDYKVQLTSL